MVDKSPRQKSTRAKSARRKQTHRKQVNRWSARVTRESNALDLDPGVFKLDSPKRIAASLEAFGGAQQAAEGRALPLRPVDAGVLCEPGRQEPAGGATKEVGAGQGRAAQAVPSRVIRPTHGVQTKDNLGADTGSAQRMILIRPGTAVTALRTNLVAFVRLALAFRPG